MIRRKKSSTGTGRATRRRRGDSPSPPRRRGSEANPPPEFAPYDYEKRCIYLMKALKGQHYPFLSVGFIHLVHELEAMLATNNYAREFMSGEMQFMNEGFYPTVNLNDRMMPKYDVMPEELTPPPEGNSAPSQAARDSSMPQEEETKEVEICLLPEDIEEDDFDEYPAYHMGTRFWTWCRRSFMGKIDSEYLENFKEVVLDPYSTEALQRFFVNEPWKYRKRAPPPPPSSKRKSLNVPQGKSAKRVSIETLSPQPSTSTPRTSNRTTLSTYRIPSRRQSERETTNNNKIVPMIGTMVITACRELKESKATPETPTSKRGKARMASREQSKERERKYAKMEVDVDEDEDGDMEDGCNGSTTVSTPKLRSPRNLKKEKVEDDHEKLENGHEASSSNGVQNGHAKEEISLRRKNGDIRNGCNGSVKSTSLFSRRNAETPNEEMEMLSDIEDFDAKAIGSRIVAKLIAGGILPESSAHIFEQMSLENDEDGVCVTTKVEMSEEGKDDAEDQEVGELAEELENLQLSLREELPAKNALFLLAWRRAKAHFAFFHTFDELRRADYDLFKLGVNMYKEYPRRQPSLTDMPVLKDSLQKRNCLARMHYSKMYRRHPKYRWHAGHVPAGRRVL